MSGQTTTDERHASPRGAFSKIEHMLDGHATGGASHIRLGDLVDGLEMRGYGLVLLILALPCCLPFVYILPQIVALPMAVLAVQMATGRSAPWLPEKLAQRSMSIESLRSVVGRARRWGGWLEALSHPRLAGLTGRLGTRITGMLLIIPCLSILVPLPLTNTVPGLGVALASVGLIERDGLFLVGGLVLGLVWVLALLVGGPALVYWIVDFALQRN